MRANCAKRRNAVVSNRHHARGQVQPITTRLRTITVRRPSILPRFLATKGLLMTGQQIIFIFISAITLGTAVVVVTNRNLFHAALAMMASFLGVAGLYVLLEAGFLAAAQLLVYIGAISILVIFAIMMTRRLMQTHEMPYNSQRWYGLIAAVLVFLLLALVIPSTWPAAGPQEASAEVLRGSVTELGRALVSPDQYVVPFELASVLLLAALVGAIVVAWPEKKI
jgi:NADH:ubiquinone oxidoreductase subunit 6 (subunit J)